MYINEKGELCVYAIGMAAEHFYLAVKSIGETVRYDIKKKV